MRRPNSALETVTALAGHPDFDWRNPNRFRALIGAFAAGNPAGFNRSDGGGYALVVDWLIRLDPVNPQTAARVAASFGAWTMLDPARRDLMRAELQRLGAANELSQDTGDIVGRLLGPDRRPGPEDCG